MDLVKTAETQQCYAAKLRRILHRNPEIGYETQNTRQVILDEISALTSLKPEKVTIQKPNESEGGIVVDIDTSGRNDRLLFRADFDALQVKEETGLEFSSHNDGLSHACGHDFHTAMLLGFLNSVAQRDIVPEHNLRLVFQDAEENPGLHKYKKSGGEILVNEGVLDDIRAAYALHIMVNKNENCGTFLSKAGAMLGNSGRIRFNISASGGHAGTPDQGVNALRAANALMNLLDKLKTRFSCHEGDVSLEPVILNAGKSSNVMPEHSELWYSFRSLLTGDSHKNLTETVISEAESLIKSMNAELKSEPFFGHPSLLNNPDIFSKVSALLEKNSQRVKETAPLLWGEDFAHYLYKVPGAMFILNAWKSGSGELHTSKFNPDENVLWRGILFWILLAVN